MHGATNASNRRARPNIQVVTNSDKTLRHFAKTTDMICIIPQVALSQPGYEGIAPIRSRALTFTRKVGLVTRRPFPWSSRNSSADYATPASCEFPFRLHVAASLG